jgi:TolB-like protein
MVGVLAVFVVAAGAVLWQRPWEPREELASVKDMAFPLPDKPSIAVLPFTNMSDDPGQGYFADGMTDDLITDLSKVGGLFVIARNSTFVYKGQAVEIHKVAEDLGVRYVVEGSVRRAGDTVRVNAQLIDATTGGHVWAERFDGEVADIFRVQDEFVRKIVEALAINLSASEQNEIGQGQTDQIEAREAFQRGWDFYLRFTAEDNAAAVSHLERAIELDPEYGRAYAALSLVYFRGADLGWQIAMGTDGWGALQLSLQYLEQARQFPTALVHVAEALDHLSHGRAEEALIKAARAIALDPNDPEAHIVMAWAMTVSGKPEEGLNFVNTAMRLDPRYPSHYVLARGIALFAMGDLNQAAWPY